MELTFTQEQKDKKALAIENALRELNEGVKEREKKGLSGPYRPADSPASSAP